MIKQESGIILSLHKSTENILNIYRLIKAPPPILKAANIVQYAELIQSLLQQLFILVPKLCVPMGLFKKTEKENRQNSQAIQSLLDERKRLEIQLEVVSQRLKQSEGREEDLKQSINKMLKNNLYYRKKAQSLKKSGQESIKNILEVATANLNQQRRSLPRLDKRQKLSLLWLMGPTTQNEKLVNHLLNKG